MHFNYRAQLPMSDEPAYIRVLATMFIIGWGITATAPAVISTLLATLCIAIIVYPTVRYITIAVMAIISDIRRKREPEHNIPLTGAVSIDTE